MRDRNVTKEQVHMVLRDPAEIITVRYGRFAAYRKLKGKELVGVYEKKNEEIEIITILWVDKRRLQRFGFTRI